MNIYTAIMKAADHIEQNPQHYNFLHSVVPSCGTPGCMLGWIGHFMGMEGSNVFSDVGPKLGFHGGFMAGHALGARGYEDLKDPRDAVIILRRFAQHFKPAQTGIPDSVREIFTRPSQTISDTAMDQRFA